ncbi:hypothetical protein H310_00804 [Aphanomyces invadans]|uniref:Centrosomal protein CEP104 N-terminal domain-containing protein n=1 Tax=Aphanomyces invadans TaxID=157072 RepID=A0A024UX24_9STRA|nr:hypothetical protein H310_00804 [Aphanomyces invadans]ETW10520.1 hypothetical protein H310_00804 [Aphanomyces invadans]|eukprot:XP_008861931.1 hypothetical protein H310_00804 [Aphanomyces invadans]
MCCAGLLKHEFRGNRRRVSRVNGMKMRGSDGDDQRDSNVAMELPYDIVYASSTDHAPIYPCAVDLMLMQAAPGDVPLRWMSSKSCSYPQEIGLMLSTRSYVKSIRVVSHLLFAPSKVDVLAADDARVQRYIDQTSRRGGGPEVPMQVYCSTECHSLCSVDWRCDGSSTRLSDIRFDLHEPLNVLKFVLHAPRVVGSNLYHQVALFQIQVLGVPLPSSPQIYPLSIPPSRGDSPLPTTNDEIHHALLDSGVPLDLVADVLTTADVDKYTAKAIHHALAVKASCIAQEDYDRAKQLTTRIAALTDVGKQFQALVALKMNAVAMEEYATAQEYHQRLETLAASREHLIAAAFAVCQASQTGMATANPAASKPVDATPPKPLYEPTIHDLAMRRWLRDERMNGSLLPLAKSSQKSNEFLVKMWGREFMACATSSAWNVRRACVEVAEQHVAILVHVFDVEMLLDMYMELIRVTFLADRTIPSLVAVLHLMRTIFENSATARTSSAGALDVLGFGSASLRRGVLRPAIQVAIDAIILFAVQFNTLLREDCVRTVRYLAQQPHVADLAIECLWNHTKQIKERGFAFVLGLRFLQDQLQIVLGRAMDAPLATDPPSQAMAQLYNDLVTFMEATASDSSCDEPVRSAALDCLTLVRACRGRDFRGVTPIAREVHVPLFRAFPFSGAETERLVHEAEAFANQHQVPIQLTTYVLDSPGLDGFEQFQELHKGSVAFVGHVFARQDVPDDMTNVAVAQPAPDTSRQPATSPSPEQMPLDEFRSTRPAHSPRQPPIAEISLPNTATPESHAVAAPSLSPRGIPGPNDESSLHTARAVDTKLESPPTSTLSSPPRTPTSMPAGLAHMNPPLMPIVSAHSIPKADAPLAVPAAPWALDGANVSPAAETVVAKATSPAKVPNPTRKNQVSPATAVPSPSSTAPGVAAPTVAGETTPRTARHSIETLQVVAEVAKKAPHADDKKAGCSIS